MRKFLLIFVCLFFNNIFAEDFTIEIKRKTSTKNCVTGEMWVNLTFVCYTLELPYIDNIPFLSSIPAGEYNAKLRYDKPDKWRIELVDVIGDRKYIQIHKGKSTINSTGCILVGKSINTPTCELAESKEAYADLKNLFDQNVPQNATINIKVIISGPDF